MEVNNMVINHENCTKCNGELEYFKLGNECPNEIWMCTNCHRLFDVPMVRIWKNKEEVK
jgi:uncharacterized protein with PIN domain